MSLEVPSPDGEMVIHFRRAATRVGEAFVSAASAGERSVAVFGSVHRGDCTPASDIDLVALTEHPAKDEFFFARRSELALPDEPRLPLGELVRIAVFRRTFAEAVDGICRFEKRNWFAEAGRLVLSTPVAGLPEPFAVLQDKFADTVATVRRDGRQVEQCRRWLEHAHEFLAKVVVDNPDLLARREAAARLTECLVHGLMALDCRLFVRHGHPLEDVLHCSACPPGFAERLRELLHASTAENLAETALSAWHALDPLHSTLNYRVRLMNLTRPTSGPPPRSDGSSL